MQVTTTPENFKKNLQTVFGKMEYYLRHLDEFCICAFPFFSTI